MLLKCYLQTISEPVGTDTPVILFQEGLQMFFVLDTGNVFGFYKCIKLSLLGRNGLNISAHEEASALTSAIY